MTGSSTNVVWLLMVLAVAACDPNGKAGDKCATHTDCGEGLVCQGERCQPAVQETASTGSGASAGTAPTGTAAADMPAKVPVCYVDEPCETGDFEGCTKLCDGGNAVACRVLARWYSVDPKTKADHDEAKAKLYQDKQVELDEGTCTKGSACGCSHLFDNYAKGYGVERDPKKAVQRAGQACKLGDPVACETLGDVYANAFPVDVGTDPAAAKRHYQRAAALRKRGCAQENLVHCTFLAAMIESGTGLEANTDQAVSLARKACDSGEGLGCGLLGRWYRQGRPGIPKDARRARDSYQRGCTLGRKELCLEVKAVEAENPAG